MIMTCIVSKSSMRAAAMASWLPRTWWSMQGCDATGMNRNPEILKTHRHHLRHRRLAEEGYLSKILRKENLTMSELYRSFFGLKREPFTAYLRIEELLETPATKDLRQRFHHPARQRAIGVVTGEGG